MVKIVSDSFRLVPILPGAVVPSPAGVVVLASAAPGGRRWAVLRPLERLPGDPARGRGAIAGRRRCPGECCTRWQVLGPSCGRSSCCRRSCPVPWCHRRPVSLSWPVLHQVAGAGAVLRPLELLPGDPARCRGAIAGRRRCPGRCCTRWQVLGPSCGRSSACRAILPGAVVPSAAGVAVLAGAAPGGRCWGRPAAARAAADPARCRGVIAGRCRCPGECCTRWQALGCPAAARAPAGRSCPGPWSHRRPVSLSWRVLHQVAGAGAVLRPLELLPGDPARCRGLIACRPASLSWRVLHQVAGAGLSCGRSSACRAILPGAVVSSAAGVVVLASAAPGGRRWGRPAAAQAAADPARCRGVIAGRCRCPGECCTRWQALGCPAAARAPAGRSCPGPWSHRRPVSLSWRVLHQVAGAGAVLGLFKRLHGDPAGSVLLSPGGGCVLSFVFILSERNEQSRIYRNHPDEC
jgi:hypothetical protein